jgi:flavin reductase (DIM6/NTAB) family NADH-FMN oxidoreductase RutF
LTVEKATLVNAPRIKECFLNLECQYLWEKEHFEDSSHVVMCVVVKNVCMEDNHFDEEKNGRYGETGYIYHISRTVNPKEGSMERNCILV